MSFRFPLGACVEIINNSAVPPKHKGNAKSPKGGTPTKSHAPKGVATKKGSAPKKRIKLSGPPPTIHVHVKLRGQTNPLAFEVYDAATIDRLRRVLLALL